MNYVRRGELNSWIPFPNSFYWGWSCLRLILMPLAILSSYTTLRVALVQVLLCFGLGLAIWRFRWSTVLNALLLAETLETWHGDLQNGPAKWKMRNSSYVQGGYLKVCVPWIATCYLKAEARCFVERKLYIKNQWNVCLVLEDMGDFLGTSILGPKQISGPWKTSNIFQSSRKTLVWFDTVFPVFQR